MVTGDELAQLVNFAFRTYGIMHQQDGAAHMAMGFSKSILPNVTLLSLSPVGIAQLSMHEDRNGAYSLEISCNCT